MKETLPFYEDEDTHKAHVTMSVREATKIHIQALSFEAVPMLQSTHVDAGLCAVR